MAQPSGWLLDDPRGPLVRVDEVRVWLGEAWISSQLDNPTAFIEDAVALASAFVRAYCTRGIPDPVPGEVRGVTLGLAVRLVRNPTGLRSAGVEGQSVGLPPIGLTWFESALLTRYRRRAA